LEQFLSSANAPQQLFETDNWGSLEAMWLGAVSAHTRTLIEWRMAQVLTTIPHLDNLIELHKQALATSVALLIERRIRETLPYILPHIDDWHTLVCIRKHVPSEPIADHLVEKRMRQVLPAILPTITEWPCLLKMWKSVPGNTPSERLVEERMFEVIFTVSADAVPEWFTHYLQNPDSIPNQHFAVPISEKARFLLIDL